MYKSPKWKITLANLSWLAHKILYTKLFNYIFTKHCSITNSFSELPFDVCKKKQQQKNPKNPDETSLFQQSLSLVMI